MKSMIPQETIEQKIFLVRGHKLMIDKDLLSCMECQTPVF